MSPRTEKLIALRARTDHELIVLVNREIERGLHLLDAVLWRNSPLFSQAEKAWTTATKVLPRITGLSNGDRLRIEAKLNELKTRLGQIPAYPNVQSFPASIAS